MQVMLGALPTMKRLPVLIIVPHGGSQVPEELSGYEALSDFDLLYESDVCANAIFSFREEALAQVDTYISRLFIDMDRSFREPPPVPGDGVMKSSTSQGKPVFGDKTCPDEIAVAAMVKRYYTPFHEAIGKIIATGDIGLILNCHTMMAVGPAGAADAGLPRPLVSVQSSVMTKKGVVETAPRALALDLLEALGREFQGEDSTVARRFAHNEPSFRGHCLAAYGLSGIPMLRVSLSRALFFNDRYFSYEYLKVDPLRIEEIRGRVWKAVDRFCSRNLKI